MEKSCTFPYKLPYVTSLVPDKFNAAWCRFFLSCLLLSRSISASVAKVFCKMNSSGFVPGWASACLTSTIPARRCHGCRRGGPQLVLDPRCEGSQVWGAKNTKDHRHSAVCSFLGATYQHIVLTRGAIPHPTAASACQKHSTEDGVTAALRNLPLRPWHGACTLTDTHTGVEIMVCC